MKREKRPWMLIYLLVGALLLSTGLNFYFLLQLDNRMWEQHLQTELQDPDLDTQTVTLGRPATKPYPPDTIMTPRP